MSLHLHRSPSNRALWNAFADRFFAELGGAPGPRFPTHAWLAHRSHRDLLLEEAEARGVPGWVGAPFSFLGDLPERLGIEGRPAGLLTRRRLLARIAAREGRRHGIAASGDGIVRGHVLDALVTELLPEGVRPDVLRSALATVEDDDFARRRNRWIVGVYEGYRAALEARGLFDPRAVPALLALAVAGRRVTDGTGGARTLHLYGLHSLRTRTALVGALAAQDEVAVHTYLPAADAPDEWDALAASSEILEADEPPVEVQPVPDQEREMRWVAERVKRVLADGSVEPHRVAVVARAGYEDTRRAHRALEEAGVPASARIRTPLSEVAALRFVLELFHGAAEGWPYRTLRNVVASPWLDCPVEPYFLDRLASERRIRGLDRWIDALASMRDEILRPGRRREGGRDDGAGSDEGPSDAQRALADRAERSREALETLADAVGHLSEPRDERGWIDATLALTDPGILRFRRRLSREVRGRFDVVRLDQRGVLQLEGLLREWRELDLSEESMDAGDWHALLVRLLEGHSLALSTPMQRGVQVLEAHDAALTPFEHVFVVHANDGVFPRPAGSGGVLTDQERRRLRDRLPLADRDLHLDRERTLWRAVTGADRVHVSWRTTDPAGQPLLPSLLVPEHDFASELSRVWKLPGTPVSDAEWMLVRAARLRSAADRVSSARAGDEGAASAEGRREGAAAQAALDAPAAVPAAPAGRLASAVLSAVAEWQRAEQARVRRGADLVASPWAGHLRDPAVLDGLARRFGADHVWSAGRLEAYAGCPFVFLVERVLGLSAAEQADEETSPLAFGGFAHDALERFYDRLERPLPDGLDARAAALLDEVLAEVRASREAEGEWLGLPVLWRQTFRQIGEAIRGHLAWELPLLAEKGHVPVATEHAFGFDPRVAITGPDAHGEIVTLPLHGRIDRVDREQTADGPVFHVIDYKSSYPPRASGYFDGATLQAALYMSAYAEETGQRCVKSGYRPVKRPSGKGSSCIVRWGDDKHRAALSAAFGIPRRVRAGHFEPVRPASDVRWPPWHPGIEVTRGRVALADGTRFDPPDRGLPRALDASPGPAAPAARAADPSAPGASSLDASGGDRG